MGLWLLLAAVVFNVRFDWQSRIAGHAFVRSQLILHQQGQPPRTINEGFRPMIRRAALEAGGWMAVIAGAGTIATVVAARKVS